MAKLHSSIHPKLDGEVLNYLLQRKIFTVNEFILEPTEKLLSITKLSYKDILRIRRDIGRQFGGIIKDPEYLLVQETKNIISTYSASLDQLLNGGLRSGHIYEFCGAPSSGKTQLCLLLATNITLNSKYNVHYIDSRGNFSATRIHSILDGIKVDNEARKDSEQQNANSGRTLRIVEGARFGFLRDERLSENEYSGVFACIPHLICPDEPRGAEVMSRIRVSSVKSIPQLLNILHNFISMSLTRSDNEMKFIIIDSLPSVFHVERENLDDLYYLNNFANMCRFLANELDISIVTVNLISHWRKSECFEILSDTKMLETKPFLGKFWRHMPNTRFFIEKNNHENRNVRVWKSFESDINSQVQINILNSGIS